MAGGRRPTSRERRQVEYAISDATGRAVNLGARAARAVWNWITGGAERSPSRREIAEAVEELVPAELVDESGSLGRRTRPGADIDHGDDVEPQKIGVTFYAPNSTNVYSYRYDHLNKDLYVTMRVYKKLQRGSDQRPNIPGVTYQYFNVPMDVWNRFRSRARADGRGGEEVWDELRQRGTIEGTRFAYSLVDGQQFEGKTYIPRRATKKGLKRRAVIDRKLSRRGQPVWDESTLPDRDYRGRRPGKGRGRGRRR